jgi:hypothetical protein
VFQILRYHGLESLELNGPQDPGVVRQGGAELTVVGAGSTPHAPLVTELAEVSPPMTEVWAPGGLQTSATSATRRTAAAAAVLLGLKDPGRDMRWYLRGC